MPNYSRGVACSLFFWLGAMLVELILNGLVYVVWAENCHATV